MKHILQDLKTSCQPIFLSWPDPGDINLIEADITPTFLLSYSQIIRNLSAWCQVNVISSFQVCQEFGIVGKVHFVKETQSVLSWPGYTFDTDLISGSLMINICENDAHKGDIRLQWLWVITEIKSWIRVLLHVLQLMKGDVLLSSCEHTWDHMIKVWLACSTFCHSSGR